MFSRIRRSSAIVALGVATALLLSACGGDHDTASGSGDSDGTPKNGGTFVSALYLEPLALDPHRQGFWETFRVSRNIFENLVNEDLTDTKGPTKLEPGLATAWKASDDGKTWTFTLRQGVTFQDGSPFNAEAVDKNVRRVSDKSYKFYDDKSAAALTAWFTDFSKGRVVNDNTYEFTFSKPFLGFPRALAQAMGTLVIGNPAVWEKYGNDKAADHPDGTGPYTFVSRKIGDRIVLKKNPDYWGTKPYLDELVFRVIPNNQTRLAALLNGEVDQISYVQPEDVKTLEKQGFQVPTGHGAAYLYLSFNEQNPAFKDEKVRQALIYGTDRQKLADELYNGDAIPLYSWEPPGNEAYDPNARDFDFDADKAKALLKEAGYDSSKPLTFTIVADVANQNLAEWLQNEYKAIGVNAKIDALDRPSYGARAYGAPDPGDGLSIDEYGGTYAEWVRNQFYSAAATKGLDPAEHPEIVKALDAASYTTDPDQRIQLWKDADQLIGKSALAIPAVSLTKYYALGANVRGFVFPATNWYDLSKVWLDK